MWSIIQLSIIFEDKDKFMLVLTSQKSIPVSGFVIKLFNTVLLVSFILLPADVQTNTQSLFM